MGDNNSKEKDVKRGAFNKAGTIVTVILSAVMIVILAVNSTLIVKSLVNKDKVPDIGGMRFFIVLTGSMQDEIMTGDLIISKEVDTQSLTAGDIISFYDPAGNGTSVVTHRIIEVTEENGERAFKTKGDANNSEDRVLVPASKVLGIYRYRLPGVGNICMFMQSTAGLVVCVVLPLIFFVLYDTVRRSRFEKKKKDDTEELKAELERLKAEKAQREAAAAGTERKEEKTSSENDEVSQAAESGERV
ncbi:MAG: signal peptidase I [Eubacteriales bacterium]|nr:signal peptidase I [Eubacteriales bacterium]